MSISSLEFNSNREYRTSEDNNSPRNQQNVTDLAQQTLTNITSTHNLPSNYVPFSPIHPQPTLDNGYQSSINLEKTYLYKRYNKIHPVINDVDDEILQTVIKHTPSKFHNNKHF